MLPRPPGYYERRVADRMAYEVSDSGCWEALLPLNHNGYASLWEGKPAYGTTLAHRLSYMLNVGPIPDGMLVCHHCDNRKCIRPDHLFLGRHADNSQDMHSKGRGFSLYREAQSCKNGHPFDEQNTGYRSNGRYCITCKKEASHRNYVRRKYGHAALVSVD